VSRVRLSWLRSAQTRQAGRARCRPGAVIPRSSGSGWRSTRTAPIRPGRSAWPSRGSGRTRPGWSPRPQTSSVHSAVSQPSRRMMRRMRPQALRSRLLYPDCLGRQGSRCRRWARACRSQRASEVNPSIACITAKVTGSVSLSCGAIPAAGRQGVSCGEPFSRSSVFTYSSVARESSSVFTHRRWTPSPPCAQAVCVFRPAAGAAAQCREAACQRHRPSGTGLAGTPPVISAAKGVARSRGENRS
jgi:hypothetical protein